ncbi:MAG: toll/interleukin-1 receptor domain-containing protein [Candidatus Promineifilaceae bacterium]|jgi:uncharacterized protein YjbI with pentapeptide repeats
MASNEHLSLISQGIEAWNQWRINDPQTRPLLSGVDLSGMDLTGVDFIKADLSGTTLNSTNLSKANLSGAVLSEADLSEANLNEAFLTRAFLFETDLSGADLSRVDLSQAFLSKANLIAADLSGACIREADLSEAVVGWTNFGNLDLSQAKGLQKVQHKGPSIVGMETIYKSGANVPEQFLQGTGLPDHFIDYIKSLSGEPADYHSAFVYYSLADEALADKLFTSLQSENVRTWLAPIDVKMGNKLRQKIGESIRLHDKLVLILSEHAIHNSWVAHFVEMVLAKEDERVNTVLFPVRVDQAVMEIETGWPAALKNTYHISDFTLWKDTGAYQKAFEGLLSSLKAASSRPKSGI